MAVIASRQIVMPVRTYTWEKFSAEETVTEYSRVSNSKGSTSYGTVESQDVYAYPDNGYQDGYWYVRV